MFGAASLQLAPQVLAVDQDARQRVVDLVNDARGELAECGQLLGVDDLPLELVHLGSVLADRDDASPPTVRNRESAPA